MIIDIIFVILLVAAMIHGYRRGLIVAVFSFIAIIIGLAAALKLSTVVANHLGHSVKVSDKWLPIISFILVFITVLLLIRLGAKLIQRITETVMLGWANRLGGIIFYAAIYTIIFSVLLFYALQVKIIGPKTIQASVTYSFIEPWGSRVIDILATVMPFFKNMFSDLEEFFGGLSKKFSLVFYGASFLNS